MHRSGRSSALDLRDFFGGHSVMVAVICLEPAAHSEGNEMEIAIETTVDAPIERVWAAWVTPDAITQWNFASDDWCCPKAEIDLVVGGKFNYRMEAKDGSIGFDFEGTFTTIDPQAVIEYALADDRQVRIRFTQTESGVRVVETFDAEDEHSAEQQRQGWQLILDNFKAHTEQQQITKR